MEHLGPWISHVWLTIIRPWHNTTRQDKKRRGLKKASGSKKLSRHCIPRSCTTFSILTRSRGLKNDKVCRVGLQSDWICCEGKLHFLCSFPEAIQHLGWPGRCRSDSEKIRENSVKGRSWPGGTGVCCRRRLAATPLRVVLEGWPGCLGLLRTLAGGRWGRFI